MPSSLAVLPPPALGFSPRPPVSACGTGPAQAIAAFPGGGAALFATASSLCRAFHSRLAPSRRVPACSAAPGCRNLRLLPFGCALRPPLRPRLSQGRQALPWKPRTFGPEDSRLRPATHSGILPSYPSTAPRRAASQALRMLPYRHAPACPAASAACFSPGHFRRGDSRPVGCYALFERVAASGPTSWLSVNPHILSHLTRTLGPWPAVWAVSLSAARLISCGLTPAQRPCGIRSLIFSGRL